MLFPSTRGKLYGHLKVSSRFAVLLIGVSIFVAFWIFRNSSLPTPDLSSVQGIGHSESATSVHRDEVEELHIDGDERESRLRIGSGGVDSTRLSGTGPLKWVIRGTISLEDKVPASALSVDIHQEGQARFVNVPVRENFTFTVNLPEEFADRNSDISVHCNLFGFDVEAQTLSFSQGEVQKSLEGVEEHVLLAHLEVEAQSIVCGTVLQANGAPAGGAFVGLFRESSGAMRRYAETRTDASGAFAVGDLEVGTTLAIVYNGARPVSIRPIPGPPLTEIAPIQLSTAGGLSGSLLLMADWFSEGHEVAVRWSGLKGSGASERVSWGHHVLRWDRGQLEFLQVRAECSEDGIFDVGGLAPGPYQVGYGGWNGGACLLGRRIGEVVIEAPASGFVVDSTPPLVRLEIADSNGLPIDRVSLWYQGERRCSARLGRIVVGIDTGSVMSLSLTKAGYQGLEVELGPSPPGSFEVRSCVLFEKLPLGSIRFVLPKDSNTSDLEFTLRRRDEVGAKPFRVVVRRNAGAFLLEGLEAGEYTIVVRKPIEQALVGWSQSFDLPASVTSGETTEVKGRLAEGGKIEVLIVDDEGTRLPATCSIRSVLAMKEIEGLEFVQLESHYSYRHNSVPHGPDSAPGYVQVLPALPAGDYIADISLEGYISVHNTVSVESGQFTQVKAVMLPIP